MSGFRFPQFKLYKTDGPATFPGYYWCQPDQHSCWHLVPINQKVVASTFNAYYGAKFTAYYAADRRMYTTTSNRCPDCLRVWDITKRLIDGE